MGVNRTPRLRSFILQWIARRDVDQAISGGKVELDIPAHALMTVDIAL
jgi:hypothetical protein